MKVMVIVKATKDSETGALPSEELLRDMGNFNESLVKAGIMLSGEGLYPSAQGARVRFSGKERSVIDGPFAETKELVAGFWIWQVKSMEEAIEWVKRCPNPMMSESEIEIRRVYAAEDFASVDPTGEVRAQEERMMQEMESYRLDPPRFEQGPAILVAGFHGHYNQETRQNIPALWQKLHPHLGKIPGQKGDVAYGVCYGEDHRGGFQYLAGVAVANTANLPAEFVSYPVPSQRYAIFTHGKQVSQLCHTFDAIHQKWFPNSGLEVAPGPVLERYAEDFHPDKEGGIEIWIPIKS